MSDESDEPRRRRRSGPVTAGGDKRAAKQLRTRVKTARGRKLSSKLWLERQLNDPYVMKAQQDGYRSRAAYKLTEINDKFRFLKPGCKIIDLGAAPGGWVQVALRYKASQVIGIDLLEMEPIAGAELIEMDFTDEKAPAVLKDKLNGEADCVLSDLAPWTTGHKATDHLRIVALVEAASYFAFEVLRPGGTFVAKVFQGGADSELLDALKSRFETVRHFKPEASRSESAETYLVAMKYRPVD